MVQYGEIGRCSLVVIKGKFLLLSYEQLWVVQYGEIGRCSLAGATLEARGFLREEPRSAISEAVKHEER